MSICRLCKQEEATKKNSHILPHFLIKTVINKGGSKQRDYELTFSFSQNEFTDLYFGRNITLETIEQYKGRELTDEELEQQNPFSQDYLFCPSCEAYFGLLEDYYSKEVSTHGRCHHRHYAHGDHAIGVFDQRRKGEIHFPGRT